MTTTSPLIEATAVAAALSADTVVLDARSGPDAVARYQAKHVAGALHADLDRDLSEKPADAAYGGRHPLPPIDAFAAKLGSWGITPKTQVIVYDDKQGANAAARLWWMLRAAGHQHVYVVNGGWDALVKAAVPLTSGTDSPKQAQPYPFKEWQLPVATLEVVENATAGDGYTVIDVRESFRYRGEREPIDLVAGHIPGAVNIPYIDNLDADGRFLSPAALREKYADLPSQGDHVIVHCGSGVTACHTLLALEHAGIQGAQLYVGSWSEWSRRKKPVATGDAP